MMMNSDAGEDFADLDLAERAGNRTILREDLRRREGSNGGGVAEEVRVEQFRGEQTDALLSFLRVTYAGEARKSELAFWKWHYLENPHTKIDDIPLWVVARGDEIVGQLATIPVQIKAGSETRPAIWILDFVVREDFRRKGLGKGWCWRRERSIRR